MTSLLTATGHGTGTPGAPVATTVAAPVAAPVDLDAALLPGPTALHRRLAARLADPTARPACLVVVGLLRKDTGWPLTTAAITTITSLLAGALRGDDWLAREDHTEFGVLVEGAPTDGDVVAARLTGVVSGAVPGVHASAGVVTLEAGLTVHEVERRALLCLDAARHRGPQAVVHYAGTR
ncbi:hypothetical protein TEK04_07310 [Klenkia sp. LSe6-5]|uniref:GGDEF domain-containing protein, diguanylate cyclase (C-di-GMP synthetase) or its enzymatically inactive variants n=1 Tax=Klenkia sesuvii TaxID=3103137 RepID=A0ABU8DSA9_9ACTN